jgi:hypothetical protein
VRHPSVDRELVARFAIQILACFCPDEDGDDEGDDEGEEASPGGLFLVGGIRLSWTDRVSELQMSLRDDTSRRDGPS